MVALWILFHVCPVSHRHACMAWCHGRSRELRHSHEGVKTELAKSDAELAQANIERGSQPGLTLPQLTHKSAGSFATLSYSFL